MINIAELLKDAPKGMKLYSPLFGEVKFIGIDKRSDYPIDVMDCNGNCKSFTEFGVYFADHLDAECLLFPSKDWRTWEGWKLPIEPKFKVGDSLQSGSHFTKILSINLEEGRYYCDNRIISFENQDLWHLVPKPHYDIANFKPFDKVLVRFCDGANWCCALFSHYCTRGNCHFVCSGGSVTQCIPFNEETKHLLGTTDMCPEEYINW